MPTKNIADYFDRFAPPQLRVLLADSEAEYVDAVEASLESAIQHMEAGAAFNCNRDERALVHELVGCLGGGGLAAQNEAHSNGHVDVTVAHWRHNGWRVLGECKIYDGPAYHVEGCEQLLKRYATGRLPRTFCLDFVKDPEIRQKMQGIRDQMDADRPLQQRDVSHNHAMRWAFVTTHGHDSGEDVAILHVGCNIHQA
jgi:hypothetical protein